MYGALVMEYLMDASMAERRRETLAEMERRILVEREGAARRGARGQVWGRAVAALRGTRLVRVGAYRRARGTTPATPHA